MPAWGLPLLLPSLQLIPAQMRDVDHVGGARGAEGDAGKDDDLVARLPKLMAQAHAAGLADHLLKAADILGAHRVRAPEQAEREEATRRRIREGRTFEQLLEEFGRI